MKKYKVKGIEIEDSGVSSYGYDIENELTKMLSEELAKEIDKEILRSLGLDPRNKRRKKSIQKIFNV
jgi:hypothetical protein